MESYFERELRETAELACDYAFQFASQDLKSLKGGRMCFYPVVDAENESIGVGVNPDYHYLIYQNRGFASFPMKWAYGRVIPMFIDGELIFRKCTGMNQFRSGFKNYWQRDIDGKLLSEYRQARAWVHPGLGPKSFIDDAIDLALDDKIDDLEDAQWYDKYGYLEEEYGI